MRFFYLPTPYTNSIIQVFNFIKCTTIPGWRSVCFFALPPLVQASLRAHLLTAVALCMLYIGKKIML